MNQYQAQNAAYKIDGYYAPPRDSGNVGTAFSAAKDECLRHLRDAVTHVEQISLADFLKARKGAKCDEVVMLKRLLTDIKAWDVDQYITIPHHLRASIEAALTPNAGGKRSDD